MPTIYASGSPNADGYLQGIEVATPSALISQLRDILQGAGLNVDETNIGDNQLQTEGSDGADKYVIDWSIESLFGNEYQLSIVGDRYGDGTAKSEPVSIPFHENIGAKLYLSVEEGGGCIYINNAGLVSRSAHFGFPYRSTDLSGSWFVGLLDQWQDSVQIAEDPAGNIWLPIHKYYYASLESHTNPSYGGYQLLWDALTIGFVGIDNFTSHSTSNTSTNLNHRPWLGAVDSITGKPNLDKYGYLIGRLPYNDAYAVPGYNTEEQTAVPLHFPGAIRFARTGLASLPSGAQYKIEGSTKTVISGGSRGEYQGFLIKG